jgi:subtilisin family serine protease
LEGLNALQRALAALDDDVAFELNAEYIADEPSAGQTSAGFSNTTPRPQSQIQPRVIPEDLKKARVAVIDSGVNPHSIFAIPNGGNFIDMEAARNFSSEGAPNEVLDTAIERAADGAPISNSNVGHGTAVAGLVGSTMLRLAAPGSIGYTSQLDKLLVPIKACEGAVGRCRNSSVVQAVCYAVSLNTGNTPVKVINLSLGSKYPSSLLYGALSEASARGMSIIASAGNKGLAVNQPLNYPAHYSLSVAGQHKAISGLVSVASVEPSANGTLAASGFSSQADSVNISALGRTEALAANSLNLPVEPRVFSGTSFSAPQVSAAASLYYAQNFGVAGITPDTFKQKLLSSATPSGTQNVQACAPNKCGVGLLNIPKLLAP